jgi:2-oxoglutarate ferredoxin oxidoreductase subunit delta
MAIGSVGTLPRRPPTPWRPLVIAEDRCKGCELCIGACPKAVLGLDKSHVNVLGYHPVQLLDAAGCTSCAICARICPDAVFTVWAAPRLVAVTAPARAEAAG